MKTVMIIDDEPLIRRGLESMIPWDRLNCRLAGSAANGEEGLKKIRELKPEVVFTDIKMPKMDGISMMKQALKEPDPPVFIVLSGYNDYDLVRSAMRLGAVDYLMKLDLEEAELDRVLREAVERSEGRAEEHSRPAASDFKETMIRELLQMKESQAPYGMGQGEICLEAGFYYRLLCIKPCCVCGEEWNESALAQSFLLNICKEHIPEGIETYEYRTAADVFVLYLESGRELPKELFAARCQNMEEAVKKYLNQEVVMGVSALHHNILSLPKALNEALLSIAFSTSGVGQRVHFYTDLLNFQHFETQLKTLLSDPDWLEAMENFLLQLQKFVTQRASREEAVKLCRILIQKVYQVHGSSKSFFTEWFDQSYETEADFAVLSDSQAVSQWLLRLEQGVIVFSQQYMGEIYRYKVKKAKEYIHENRFQRISLNEVAAQLEITPSYLSRIFKKVTQKSFSDYIAEVKIEEAKKLLLKDNNRIYEVSSMLGYEDSYYFSKVFKRVTQMTPSEYIARN